MKLIMYLMGLVTLLTTVGCEISTRDHYRGGAYDGYNQGYGHGESREYPYDRDHNSEYHRD